MGSPFEADLPPEVLDAARRGEPAAQQQIYEQFAGPVFRLLRRLVGPLACDDVFQDAMMRVFERLAGYRGDAPLGMWIRAIAVNGALSHLRSPWQRARGVLRGAADAEGRFEMDDFDQLPAAERDSSCALDLARLLRQLPATARTVVWLYEIEGLSHQEIATAFGRSTSFSKTQLGRARARLAELAAPAAKRSLQGYRA